MKSRSNLHCTQYIHNIYYILFALICSLSLAHTQDAIGQEILGDAIGFQAIQQAISEAKLATNNSQNRSNTGGASYIKQVDNVAIIQFDGNYDQSLNDGSFNIQARIDIAQAFYQEHADDYDFLSIFTDFEFDTGDNLAFFHSVKNQTSGIGQAIFDNTQAYQSHGRLQGVIDMAATSRYSFDTLSDDFVNPSTGYGLLTVFSHEIMHNWMQGVDIHNADGSLNSNLRGFRNSHWSFLTDSAASVMGGAQWQSFGNQQHRASLINQSYNDWDLYLAGFLAEQDVSAIDVITTATAPNELFPALNDEAQGLREPYAIQQLSSLYGPRLPSAANSQKQFRVGFIYLVRDQNNIDTTAVEQINAIRAQISNYFHLITRRKASLRTHLSPSDGSGIGQISTIVAPSQQTQVVNAQQALDWLISRQNEDGSWSDKAATQVRDTAVTSRLIRLLRPQSAAWRLGRDWLDHHHYRSNDERLWALSSGVLSRVNIEILAAQILNQQHDDGGWGLDGQYLSSPLDTAFVLSTVQNGSLNITPSQQQAAQHYLTEILNNEGLAGLHHAGATSFLSSLLVYRALSQLTEPTSQTSSNNSSQLLEFLLSQQQANGSFGSVSDTAMSLTALSLSPVGAQSAINQAINYLSMHQDIEGHWQNSIYATAISTQVLSEQQLINLSLGNVEFSPPRIIPGDRFTLSVGVRNSGGQTSQAVLLSLVKDSDPTTSIADDLSIPALAPGEHFNAEFLLDSTEIQLDASALLIIDRAQSQAEFSREDNRQHINFPQQVATEGIDLSIREPSVTLTAHPIRQLPTTLTIDAFVQNLGQQDAEPSQSAIYAIQASGNPILLAQETAPLSAGDRHQLSTQHTISDKNIIALQFVVDENGVVNESDENNNTLTLPIHYDNTVDIAAESLQIDESPLSLGNRFPIRLRIANRGTLDVENLSASLIVEHEQAELNIFSANFNLAAGQIAEPTVDWRPIASGEHMLTLRVDESEQYIELDEENNQLAINVTVDGATLPNLRILPNISTAPEPLLSGQTAIFTTTIINDGATTNAPIKVALYQGDPSNSEAVSSAQLTEGLASGQQSHVDLHYIPTGQGEQLFAVEVDPQSLINEVDKTDNTAIAKLQVLGLADLQISPAAISLNPSNPNPGDTVTIDVQFSNAGQQATNEFSLQLSLLQEQTAIFERTLNINTAVAAGNSHAISAEIQWPDHSNELTVNVNLDIDDVITEQDESNNQAAISITQQSGPLHATELYISPNGDLIKDDTLISYFVAEAAEYHITIKGADGEIVQEYSDLPPGQQGSILWNGRNEQGRIVLDGAYQVQLLRGNSLIANRTIHVDTNRTALANSIGTPRQQAIPLSCEIGTPDFGAMARFSNQVSDNGDHLFFVNPALQSNGQILAGIYAVDTQHQEVISIIDENWLLALTATRGTQQVINNAYPLGSDRILFTADASRTPPTGSCNDECASLWVTNLSGQAQEINFNSSLITEVIDQVNEQQILVYDSASRQAISLGGDFYLLNLDGINPPQQLQSHFEGENPARTIYYIGSGSHYSIFSDHIELNSNTAETEATRYYLLPLSASGAQQRIETNAFNRAALSNQSQFAFLRNDQQISILDLNSPNAAMVNIDISHLDTSNIGIQWRPSFNHLVLFDRSSSDWYLYDQQGNLIESHQFPLTQLEQLQTQYQSSLGGLSNCADKPGTSWFAHAPVRQNPYRISRPTASEHAIVQAFFSFSPNGEEAWWHIDAINEVDDGEICVPTSLARLAFYHNFDSNESYTIGVIPDSRSDNNWDGTEQIPLINPELSELSLNQFDTAKAFTWLLPGRGIVDQSGHFIQLGIHPGQPNFVELNTELNTIGSAFEFNSILHLLPSSPNVATQQAIVRANIGDTDFSCPNNNAEYWSLRNLDNLIAQVSYELDGDLLNIKATATDRNFSHYQLEWINLDEQNNGVSSNYRPIVPFATNEVNAESISFWSPPQAGRFRIRLSVFDQAGNQASDSVDVLWSENPDLTALDAHPSFISPNADEINDHLVISYRAQRSVQLNIEIYDSSNLLVRTIRQNIINPTGALEHIQWDGRAQNGALVPDGRYSVLVNGHRLSVVVDNTAPRLITNDLSIQPSSLNPVNDIPIWFIEESSPATAQLEVFLTDVEQWLTLDSTDLHPLENTNNPDLTRTRFNSFPIELLAQNPLRISIIDEAGNRTSSIEQYEKAIFLIGSTQLSTSGDTETDEFGLISTRFITAKARSFARPSGTQTGLYLAHTLGPKLDTIRLEFSELDPTSPWLPLTLIDDARNEIEAARWNTLYPDNDDRFWLTHRVALWQAEHYPELSNYRVRMVASDNSGNEYISNTVTFNQQFEINTVAHQPTSPWAQALLNEAINGLNATQEDQQRIWFSGISHDSTPAANIRLSIGSFDDPRFAQAVQIAPSITVEETLGNEIRFVSVFDASLICPFVYQLSATANVVSVEAQSTSVNLPFSLPISCGPRLSLSVSPKLATECNVPTAPQIYVDSEIIMGSVQSLVYSLHNPVTGEAQIIDSDTTVSNINHKLLDVGFLAPGSYQLIVSAQLSDNTVVEASQRFLVQDTPPAANITYPAIGETVCATISDTTTPARLTFDVEGTLAQATGLSYRVGVHSLGSGFANSEDNRDEFSGQRFPSSGVAEPCDPLIAGDSSRCRFQPESFNQQTDFTSTVKRQATAFQDQQAADVIVISSNWSGQLSCSINTFNLDTGVDARPIFNSSRVFSPNNDGVLDTFSASISLNEVATLDLSIYPATQIPGQAPQISGPAILHPISGLSINGDYTYEWNGRGDQGIVRDGLYLLIFTLVDNCGFLSNIQVLAEVDNTAPTLSISTPAEGSVVSQIIEIFGSAEDLNFNEYRLAFQLSGTENRTLINTADEAVQDTLLGRLQTNNITEPFDLILSATDHAGNQQEVRVGVTPNTSENLIADIALNPEIFSPDANNVRDFLNIAITNNIDILLSLEVRTPQGQVVHEINAQQTFNAGTHHFVWDGSNLSGEVAADGRYEVFARAQRGTSVQEQSLSFQLDNTAPSIETIYPDRAVASADRIAAVSIQDLSPTSVNVELRHQNGIVERFEDNYPASTQAHLINLVDLSDLPEGDYELQIRVEDEAGNHTQTQTEFLLDATPPISQITQPINQQYWPSQQTPLAISGIVNDAHLHTLRIEYRPTQGQWIPLHTVFVDDEVQQQEITFTWQAAALLLSDGDYEIALLGIDEAGNEQRSVNLIHIDNTVPHLGLSSPSNNARVAPGEALVGSISDLNLQSYTLAVRPSATGPNQPWSDFSSGNDNTTGIIGQVPAFTAEAAELSLDIRIQATDLAGNSQQLVRSLILDRQAPDTPENLIFTRPTPSQIQLSWTAVNATDLAAYQLLRNGQDFGESLAQNQINLGQLSDGRHEFQVLAVDQSGNRSDPSNSVSVLIDTQAPVVQIHSPARQALISGMVEIHASAYGDDDLSNYQLKIINPNSTEQLLMESSIPAQSKVLTILNSNELADGAYILSLSATDRADNTATTLAPIKLDNTAPNAPELLSVDSIQQHVKLNWSSNTEGDLAGYLVYRNGDLISASFSSANPASIAIVENQYLDENVPDGHHLYQIRAVDQAGNLSAPSNTLEISTDHRSPTLTWVSPLDQTEFDFELTLEVSSEDEDIAQVEFSYREQGANFWTALSSVEAPPFRARFDPAALAFGHYDLQAIASDTSGNIDNNPPVISVYHRDLTAPNAVSALSKQVTRNQVLLQWQAPNDEDLAGFFIERNAGNGFSRINTQAQLENNYLDSGLVDGHYRYQVIAVDQGGNESAPQSIPVLVFTPELSSNVFITTENALQFEVQSLAPGTATLTLSPSNTEISIPVTADQSSVTAAINLSPGENQLQVQVHYDENDLSNIASLLIQQSNAPSTPSGLSADIQDDIVQLSWQANPESNIAGYRLFQESQAVLPANPAIAQSASANINTDLALFSIDSNLFSYWSVSGNQIQDGNAAIIFELSEAVLVEQITLNWGNFFDIYPPQAFRIQAWHQDRWFDIANQASQLGFSDTVLLTDGPISNRLRLIIEGDSPIRGEVRLSEFSVTATALINGLSHNLQLPRNQYRFQLSAVNEFGLESEKTEPLNITVGDFTPPQAIELSAQNDGHDVILNWVMSQEADFAGYQIYRNDESIFSIQDINLTQYHDSALSNGVYHYQISVLDSAGNESPRSNSVSVEINQSLPQAPSDLTLTPILELPAFDLSWTAPTSNNISAYRVSRGTSSDGPFLALQTVSALAFRDTSITVETNYFYTVQALDNNGNLSAFSNVVNGFITDQKAPETPRILSPVNDGENFTTGSNVLNISGSAEPGAVVELSHNNSVIRVTNASLEASLVPREFNGFVDSQTQFSPDGQWFVASNFPRSELINLANGTRVPIQSSFPYGHWSQDSQIYYYRNDDFQTLHQIDVRTQEDQALLTQQSLFAFAVSPDQQQVFLVGEQLVGGNIEPGLWIQNLQTGAISETLHDFSIFDTLSESISWSPDSRHLSFVSQGNSKQRYLHQLGQNTQLIQSNSTTEAAQWSDDSQALVYSGFDDNFNQQIFHYHLTQQSANPLTTGFQAKQSPVWSQDQQAIFWIEDQRQIVRFTLLSQDHEAIAPDNLFFDQLHKLDNGQVRTVAQGNILDLVAAGQFAFQQLLLQAGQNQFSTRAIDAAGNSSLPSLPISVDHRASGQTDLSWRIEDTFALPNTLFAQETININLNAYSFDYSDRHFDARVSILNEDRQIVGSSQDIRFDTTSNDELSQRELLMTAPTIPGVYQLIAQLDPNSNVVETDESNNRFQQTITVLGNEPPRLNLRIEEQRVLAGDELELRVDLFNPGTNFLGQLQLLVFDSTQQVVATLINRDIGPLSQASTESLEATWLTNNLFAGSYSVQAKLFDNDGAIIDSDAVTIEVVDIQSIVLSLDIGDGQYQQNRLHQLQSSIAYLSGQTPLAEATLNYRIVDSSGAEFYQRNAELGLLLPGTFSQHQVGWMAIGIAPGDYFLEISLHHREQLLAIESQPISVVSAPAVRRVVGTLNIASAIQIHGAGSELHWQLHNVGDLPDSGFLRFSLLNRSNNQATLLHQEALNLDSTASVDGTYQLQHDELVLGSHTFFLHWDSDHDDEQLIDSQSFELIDATPPLIEIQSPRSISPANTLFSARVQDLRSNVSAVQLQLIDEQGNERDLAFNGPDNELAYTTFSELTEGMYQYRIRAQDSVGNTALSMAHFMVDSTAPTIAISGVEPNQVSTSALTPLIQVEDPHLETVSILLNNQTYSSGTTITETGDYQLDIIAIDTAGNRAEQALLFTINSTQNTPGNATGQLRGFGDAVIPRPYLVQSVVSNNGDIDLSNTQIRYRLRDSQDTLIAERIQALSLSIGHSISDFIWLNTELLSITTYQLSVEIQLNDNSWLTVSNLSINTQQNDFIFFEDSFETEIRSTSDQASTQLLRPTESFILTSNEDLLSGNEIYSQKQRLMLRSTGWIGLTDLFVGGIH
jgi:flagellar hook assembly protein FlgD/fibronectin type 3 domain-containing protein